MLIGFGIEGSGAEDPAILQSSGCEKLFFYQVPIERKERLDQMLEFARNRDVVVIVDFDRIGSTIREVLDVVTRLEARGVTLQVEKYGVMPDAPLGLAFGAVCKILQQVEAREIREANLNRRRGRPSILDSETQAKALQMLSSKASVLDVARTLRVSPATIYRYFPKRTGRRSKGQGT